MKTPNASLRRPKDRKARAALAVLAAAAAVLVFAPAGAEAQNRAAYGIYKCTASYYADYCYVDTRVADVDFQGGRWVRLGAKANYYMVVDDAGFLDLIYFDRNTLMFSRIDNCPYDCHDYLDVDSPRGAKLTISGCSVQAALEIFGGGVDGRRCEMYCLTGLVRRGGNPLTIPGLGGNVPPGTFFSFAPATLQGTYCRVTCYHTGRERYVEPNLGLKNFSYNLGFQDAGGMPANGYAIACVTGKVNCRLDRALTIDFINNTDNGITTVTNYLVSQGYVLNQIRTWAQVDQFPAQTPFPVPFLP